MKTQSPSNAFVPLRPFWGGIGKCCGGGRFSNSRDSGERVLRRVVLLDIALDHARENPRKTNISSWGNL